MIIHLILMTYLESITNKKDGTNEAVKTRIGKTSAAFVQFRNIQCSGV